MRASRLKRSAQCPGQRPAPPYRSNETEQLARLSGSGADGAAISRTAGQGAFGHPDLERSSSEYARFSDPISTCPTQCIWRTAGQSAAGSPHSLRQDSHQYPLWSRPAGPGRRCCRRTQPAAGPCHLMSSSLFNGAGWTHPAAHSDWTPNPALAGQPLSTGATSLAADSRGPSVPSCC